MNKNTINALIARGVDSYTAANLSSKGFTINSLKQMSKEALNQLGFSYEHANSLLRENRPPIPDETLLKVLYKSRRTCCICRDPQKPIVVHHIEEWASSRNHGEENLIVVCLEHHDLAHTKKELSQGLSKKELVDAKKQWEKNVELLDAKTILQLKNDTDYSRWDWVNIQRIFELFLKNDIAFEKNKLIDYLEQKRFIDSNGVLTDPNQWLTSSKASAWFLDFGEGMYVSTYLSSIIEQLLLITPVIDITPLIKTKKELKSILAPNDYIVAQLPFYFSDIEKFERGKNQLRKSYYRGYGVRIEYTFNAWHCFSSSARFDAMTGRKVQTIFALVRSITEDEGELQISVSCLAAGTAFSTHAARS